MLRNLVGRHALAAPCLESGVIEVRAVPGHDEGGDRLAPDFILNADDRDLGDGLVGQQHAFDFQRGQLVAAGLDDVHRGAAHDAVVAVLDHRHVAGAEPAVDKALAGGFLVAPVFEEHVFALDADFAGIALAGDGPMVVIEQLHLDSRQRLADVARAPLALIGIGDAHADFGHAVALEQHLAGEFAPLFEQLDRAGRRAGNVQPHGLEARAGRGGGFRVPLFEILDQLDVDRGHRHEHIVSSRRDPGGDLRQIEPGEQIHPRPRPQPATEDVDDAVNVMQRQEQRDDVIFGPAPGVDQGGDLGADRPVGAHRSLGLARGAAGEQHHGAAAWVDLRQLPRRVGQHLG